MTAFSPGIIQGCFDLLDMASRMSLSFSQITLSFGRLSGLPVEIVIETAQTLRWLATGGEGFVSLTPAGSKLLMLDGYEQKLRQALLDYIDAIHPPWVQNAIAGRSRVLSFASSDIRQVFVEAGLAHGTEHDVVVFWDMLAARARGQKNIHLTEIGREGERLTLAYEENRTGRRPRWVSIDSNGDGYDILSVLGPGDGTQLSIEVKTTQFGLNGYFHLTMNEWDRALCFENHVFHLWDISGIPKQVAVLEKSDVEPHVPKNRGRGLWESVEIPYYTFYEKFCPHV